MDPITFKRLIMTFKHPNTGKRMGSRTFTANTLDTLLGYQHNRTNLWGELPNGKRKHLKGRGGSFGKHSDDSQIIWYPPC